MFLFCFEFFVVLGFWGYPLGVPILAYVAVCNVGLHVSRYRVRFLLAALCARRLAIRDKGGRGGLTESACLAGLQCAMRGYQDIESDFYWRRCAPAAMPSGTRAAGAD